MELTINNLQPIYIAPFNSPKIFVEALHLLDETGYSKIELKWGKDRRHFYVSEAMTLERFRDSLFRAANDLVKSNLIKP